MNEYAKPKLFLIGDIQAFTFGSQSNENFNDFYTTTFPAGCLCTGDEVVEGVKKGDLVCGQKVGTNLYFSASLHKNGTNCQ